MPIKLGLQRQELATVVNSITFKGNEKNEKYSCKSIQLRTK